jgi:hypothetical protein
MLKMVKACLLFCCCMCLWQAPASSAAEAITPQQMLSPNDQAAQVRKLPLTLYFRYRSSALLGRERRAIFVPVSGPYELSIVRALLDGPGSLSPHLSPLFPPGTQALSAVVEGGTLFVTFNETIMGHYPDEPLIMTPDYSQGEGALRRRLAMAGLVNTLTEVGRYRAVQVLVRGETYIATSMRLSMRYYLQDSDDLPDPLVRQEAYIQSPQTAAQALLSAWQGNNWTSCYPLLISSAQTLPSEYELIQIVRQAPSVLDYTLTAGIVGLDGQSAIVSVDYTLRRANGSTQTIQAFPLKVLLIDGIYRIPYESLRQLLELPNE